MCLEVLGFVNISSVRHEDISNSGRTWRRQVLPKRRCHAIKLHGVTSYEKPLQNIRSLNRHLNTSQYTRRSALPPTRRQLTSCAIIVSLLSLNELNRACEVFVFTQSSQCQVCGSAFSLFYAAITTPPKGHYHNPSYMPQWVQPEVHTGYFKYTH